MTRFQTQKFLSGALLGFAWCSAYALSGQIVDPVDPRNLSVVVAPNWVPCQQATVAVVDTTQIGLNGPKQLGWRSVTPSSPGSSSCPMSEARNKQKVKQVQNQIQAQINRAVAQKRMVNVGMDGKIVPTGQRISGDKVVAKSTTISSAQTFRDQEADVATLDIPSGHYRR